MFRSIEKTELRTTRGENPKSRSPFYFPTRMFLGQDVCMCTDTPAFRSLPHCAQEPRSQTAAGSHGKDAVFSMCFSVTWSQMFPDVPRCSQGPTDLSSSLHPPRRSLPPPLSLRRWSCGWSDLWIRSSASSSSSCWCRGRSSWLCCSPPWYRFYFFYSSLSLDFSL